LRILLLITSVFSMGFLFLLGGCAATPGPGASSGAKLPWWVAQPSAPLPEGFPSPGPLHEVILKQYPPYRSATVSSATGKTTPRGMFFPLFEHIEKNHIPMSSPIEITYAPSDKPKTDAMAFIYADPATGKPGADGIVEVQDHPALTVASIGVTGAYSDQRFAEAHAQLRQWLIAHANEYVRDGSPRYLGYNSPFVLPFARYGEVQVPVRPATPPK